MRFTATSILALPLLAAAAQEQSPLDQAKDAAQYYLNKFVSYIPHTNTFHAAEAALAREGGKNVEILTLDNWKTTLRSSVTPKSKGPEEWWVLLTGGNQTCHGYCDKMNTAFNETALLFKADPHAPHLGYVNCDLQPILCNSWGAGPPSMWVFDVRPEPQPVDIHIVAVNVTTVTAKTFLDLKADKSWKEKPAYEGVFHPFNGQLAKFGVAVPLAWILFGFSVVPNWLFMIAISFASRTMM
jgi:hypothetical protein